MVSIRNRLFDASGSPIQGAYVAISLSNPGYLDDGTIVAPITTTTDADGLWEVDLPPNDSILPVGSHYRVNESGILSFIIVPESEEEPLEMTTLLVSSPEVAATGVFSVDERSGVVSLADRYTPIEAMLSTGVLSGGALSVNASDTQAIDIAAIEAFIVDNLTDPADISVTRVSKEAVTVPLSDDSKQRILSWFMMDQDGVITQQGAPPTPIERRQKILIGSIAFNPQFGIVLAAKATPVAINQSDNQMTDLIEALGPFSTFGNRISANGAGLSLTKTAGRMFSRAFAHQANPGDPHEVNAPAQNPVQLRRIASVSLPEFPPIVTTIDPVNFDLDGVITPVPGGSNRSTIQRVWLSSAENTQDQITVQYGQTVFQSLSEALANVGVGDYVVNPVVDGIAALLAYIVVARGATDLTDMTDALIINAGKFAAP